MIYTNKQLNVLLKQSQDFEIAPHQLIKSGYVTGIRTIYCRLQLQKKSYLPLQRLLRKGHTLQDHASHLFKEITQHSMIICGIWVNATK